MYREIDGEKGKIEGETNRPRKIKYLRGRKFGLERGLDSKELNQAREGGMG